MSKPKFTPGPWDARDIDVCAGGDRIALVIGYVNCKANANLIAVGPKMYEALANLENDDGRAMPPSAWALVQEALREARGEE